MTRQPVHPIMSGPDVVSGSAPGAGLTQSPSVLMPSAKGRIRASARQVLFVAGMHRSGTSCLAQALGELGWGLPQDSLAGSADNPGGHFEPAAVVQLNDRLLRGRGWRWDRITALPRPSDLDRGLDSGRGSTPVAGWGDFGADAAIAPSAFMGALKQSFGASSNIVVKDPRFSHSLPIWREMIAEIGFNAAVLVALRDPVAVARSLMRRNGFDATLSILMWCGQTLSAVEAAREMPSGLVLFPDWESGRARSPRTALNALAWSGNPKQHDARPPHTQFDADLLQCQKGPAPVADDAALALAARIFETLSGYARTGGMPSPATLRSFRHRFERLTRLIRATELNEARHLIADDELRRAEIGARSDGIALLERRLAATEKQRDDLGRIQQAEHASAQALCRRIEATEGQRDIAVGELGRLAATVDEGQAKLVAMQAERNRLADRFAHVVDAAAEQKEKAAAAASQAAERQADLETELAAVRADADTARAESDQARVTSAAQYEELKDRLTEAEQSEEALAERLSASSAELLCLQADYADLSARIAAERMSVLRPVYRNIHALSGRALRRWLPEAQVERIKKRVPAPDGIPAKLAATARAPNVQDFVIAGPPPGVEPRQAGCDRPDIFIFSIINWDFRTQRPQHLARQMAARGHRVFYVEMESDVGGRRLRCLEKNLYVLRLGTGRAGLIATYSGVPSDRQARNWIDAFHGFCHAIDASVTRHLIVQHPYWWAFVRHLPAENRITFDCMDDLSGFSNTLPHMLEAEADMIRQADRMIVSSEYLRMRHSAERAVALVRNAADSEHFHPGRRRTDMDGSSRFADETKPGATRAGYVGAIAEWFDTELLAAAAVGAPEIQFHLCGAVTDKAALALGNLANVTLHGEIAYHDVPGFIAQMDVMIIPFRLTPIIRACDPVKFYEHCAAGKPTVSTPLPELVRAGDRVLRADAPGSFIDAIHRANQLGRDDGYCRSLMDYAAENTWSLRAETFLAEMMKVPKVSVVILAYGDAHLTLAALQSLTVGGGSYPNLEIIVVDNGSDGTARERLQDIAATDPRIRLIENPENLGFARGNNIGIGAASGDYVMLMNNDTYAAAGAISAMVRHLELDPGLGVVGPLTNAIGNEARVEVAYSDMSGMTEEMRRVTTGHRGQRTDVRVCAYFCVMFRRSDLSRFGPLSEEYGLGMFEDDDHCAAITAAGSRCAVAEDAFVHHHLSATFGALAAPQKAGLFARNRALFERRWGPWVPHRYRAARPASTLGAA